VGQHPLDVLIGVTGGIAAYRTGELVRLLVRDGLTTQVVATPAALRFVGEATLAGLSRRAVLTDQPRRDGPIYPHLEASRAARIVVIAPCSANTLAKIAHGLADNVLCESVLAATGPLLIAPAMNSRMWTNTATRTNTRLLAERGVTIIGPDHGELAEGGVGEGRMAQPDVIARAVHDRLAATGSLRGVRVLVTAGGTREPLDAVRYLGNRSSGRMGVALADEALRRGADVTSLLANTSIRPCGGRVLDTPTTADLQRETLAHATTADIILMAAAVADFRPPEPHPTKRERTGRFTLELVATDDILAQVAANRRDDQVLVGFAAEDGDGIARAEAKRARKQLDLIVLNDISQPGIGFDTADNEVVLVTADTQTHVARAPKPVIARAILDQVEAIRSANNPAGAAS
jgi:phosphopantothenoylcysteine decarboxylase / phosphopantothenate---cysteine ligase